MDPPGRQRKRVLVGGVTAPEALDERGRGNPAADHVLLALLLLNFERESASQDSL